MHVLCFVFCLLVFFSLYLFEDLLEDWPLQTEGAFLHKLTKKKNIFNNNLRSVKVAVGRK